MKRFPFKYDTFDSIEDLKEYIRRKIIKDSFKFDPKLKIDTLNASIYYLHSDSKNYEQIVYIGVSFSNKKLCKLRLSWDLDLVIKAIDEIKNEYKII